MAPSRQYLFGEFLLDADQRALFRRGNLVPLAPKSLETLLFLVERHGRIVEKKDLLEAVWPGTFVEEVGLARNISTLRKVLSENDSSENEDGQSYIETIPKRGYRFIALVSHPALLPTGGTSPANHKRQPGESLDAVPTSDYDFRKEGTDASVLLKSQAATGNSDVKPLRRRHPGKRLAAIALAMIPALGLVLYWRSTRGGHLFPSQRITLAVLPVQNLSGDPAREYVTDGLTEEMIAHLGALNPERLGVIARTSSMAYKGSQKTAAQIGRELGVDYLLETSMRPHGDNFRFTAQLIRMRDQSHVWAQDYDENAADIVNMEDRVAQSVMELVRLELSPAAQQKLAIAHPVDPVAHDLYLKGRFAQSMRSREGLEKSLEYFQQAIARDPQNALAYAGIADSLNLENFYGFSPGSATILNAQNAAQKAIQLDDSLAEGHAAMAYLTFMWLWEWPTAEHEFRRAIALNQNYAPAHHWYALYLAAMNRRGEAVREIQMAQSLDPLSPIVNTAVGYIYFFNREYDRAIVACQTVLAQNPKFAVAHTVLGRTYDAKGMYNEAIVELERTIEISGSGRGLYLAHLGHAYAGAGRIEDAKKILAEMYDLPKRGEFIGLSGTALVYAGLGDNENAILNLLRARGQNDPNLIWLRVEPAFDAIRDDPRIQELLKR